MHCFPFRRIANSAEREGHSTLEMGCCHVTEGTLEEPASFDLKSVTEGDEKPDIQSPVFIIEDGTMRIHFNQKAEEYKAPDSPLNRAFTEFVGAFYPLLHGDSIRQQRLDSLMRSELSRHNDDILGMQALAMVYTHVKPTTVASWLELMSPRVKAGEANTRGLERCVSVNLSVSL